MPHLWLIPAAPLALFGIGLGLRLCDIKPGLWLMAAAWLLCVPAAIYGSVRLAMTLQRAVADISYTEIGAAACLVIVDLMLFGSVIYILKYFQLRIF
jgi:hypothetical protein